MDESDWSKDYIAEKDLRPKVTNNKSKYRSNSKEKSFSRKRTRISSKSETEKTSKPAKKPLELETDSEVLQRRQKQIDYGKNTVGYQRYIQQTSIEKRTKDDPRTPDKYCKYSRRSWDMLIKIWRKNLHKYDIDGGSEKNSMNSEDDEDEEETDNQD